MQNGTRPLILVTNDDGYFAGGITALVEVAKDFGDVLVVSPNLPQSGMGHAITINQPLRLQRTTHFGDMEAYSCTGTPVDCVKLAIYGILKKKPDLIISGINHGANFSINVLYSGTMSAAVEGAIEGIPSIGFSLLHHDKRADFNASKKIANKVIREALKNGISKNTCLNVNIPRGPFDDIRGIRVCRQGVGHWEDEFIERRDPSGEKYYWMSGSFGEMDKGEDTDSWALKNNYVSIVPVQFDMTAHQEISSINNWEL
ncbi:MAG: 5'/3'-nucleotidase SurE [Flavobacteriales bacterium]|nr:5'/3'-nucleotidase SurE [Flavobacteriales bacterium]